LVSSYLGLAAVYRENQRLDEAQAVFERGLAMAPTSEELLTQYSLFLNERGDENDALQRMDDAIRLGPTATTLIARASLYQQLGRAQESEEDLKLALQKEPGSFAALIALGDLYRGQEDLDKAEQQYQAALSLWPGMPTGYLRLGDLASKRGDIDGARTLAKAAHDLEPGSLTRSESETIEDGE
jgi:tetratricopeptide (TPR) repeat protein